MLTSDWGARSARTPPPHTHADTLAGNSNPLQKEIVEERRRPEEFDSPFNANQEETDANARHMMVKRSGPALRLDVDLDAMPPASAPRREFVQRFQEDIARTVNIQADAVNVTGMRHAPNLDW